jgi:hypothetical protein
MGAVRNALRVLVEKPKGKTPLQRDTNERIIYLKMCETVDWIHLA